MQALKDAGIVLVVLLLVFSVRITPIESVEAADENLLAPSVEAATTGVEPAVGLGSVEAMPRAVTAETVDRCTRIVLELTEGTSAPEPYVVVLETEEDAEGAPCSRT